MAENINNELEHAEGKLTILKFCPICGDTMHQEDYLGAKWWFCDDPECGFFEPVK